MSSEVEETAPAPPAAEARRNASAAIGAAGEKLQENPIAMLLGGLALGALVGALLPRSEREAALLGPLGERIGDAAREAFEAARATGYDQLDELGLSKDGARESMKSCDEREVAAGDAIEIETPGGGGFGK